MAVMAKVKDRIHQRASECDTRVPTRRAVARRLAPMIVYACAACRRTYADLMEHGCKRRSCKLAER